MTAATILQARFGSLTPDQVAALDAAAMASGVQVLQLMEISGLQVASCAWDMLGGSAGSVTVCAGRGNNGGDGLVAARLLASWGCPVLVHVLLGEHPLKELLARHLQAAAASGVEVSEHRDHSEFNLPDSALVIDALLGTGLRSAPYGLEAAAIRSMNAAGRTVLSIDVPSGLDAHTGEAFEPCVRAARTCTLAAVKAGLWQPSAAPFTGELVVADIGMPLAAWRACGLVPPTEVTGGRLLPVPSTTG